MTSKKIIIKSCDGESFEIDEAVAIKSSAIKHMMEDECTKNGIRLPYVTGAILAKVIEYCKKHVESDDVDKDTTENDELKKWDTEFVQLHHSTLFDLILAANYLRISGLMDLMCQYVVDIIRGKTPEQIRAHFNLRKRGNDNY